MTGTAGVLFAFLSVWLLSTTVAVQKKELKETRDELIVTRNIHEKSSNALYEQVLQSRSIAKRESASHYLASLSDSITHFEKIEKNHNSIKVTIHSYLTNQNVIKPDFSEEENSIALLLKLFTEFLIENEENLEIKSLGDIYIAKHMQIINLFETPKTSKLLPRNHWKYLKKSLNQIKSENTKNTNTLGI